MNEEMEKLLSELFEETTALLLERIRSGEANSGEIGCALKLLQQNNITIPEPEVDEEETDLHNLAKYLPNLMDDGIPNANIIRETIE